MQNSILMMIIDQLVAGLSVLDHIDLQIRGTTFSLFFPLGNAPIYRLLVGKSPYLQLGVFSACLGFKCLLKVVGGARCSTNSRLIQCSSSSANTLIGSGLGISDENNISPVVYTVVRW